METRAPSRPHNFIGMNIKGTPAMKARAVRHDLGVAQQNSDVCVLQEFKWPWYWRAMTRVLPNVGKARWRSSPGRRRGYAHPVMGAQTVMWRGSVWQLCEVRVEVLHLGVPGISETRHLRAVLLQERQSGRRCWFVTTHFVVGGDEKGDGPKRRKMLARNIAELDEMLSDLIESNYPVICQLDANIRKTSAAYADWRRMLTKHGATIHGYHGVEYLFTIDNLLGSVKVIRSWQIPTSALKTDHEGRGITFRLT